MGVHDHAARVAATAFLSLGVMLAGCVQPKRTPEAVPDSYGASAPAPAETARASAGQGQPAKRYYRDVNGQLYYVDEGGALHTVYRSSAVVRDSGGGLYYVEDESRPFYRDDGGRFYFRDDGNRVLYLEDAGPGEVIDPLRILRGAPAGEQVERGERRGGCAGQLSACLAGCGELADPASRKACYSRCERARERCGDGIQPTPGQ
ncbi:MAG: hypothetical protein ACOZEN_02420 [Thermodesulfobacteriota bacterium]